MSNNVVDYLRKAGLTNHDTFYDDMVSNERRIVVAYCDSYKCTGKHHGKMRVRKFVKGKPDFCPDCRNALYYSAEQ